MTPSISTESHSRPSPLNGTCYGVTVDALLGVRPVCDDMVAPTRRRPASGDEGGGGDKGEGGHKGGVGAAGGAGGAAGGAVRRSLSVRARVWTPLKWRSNEGATHVTARDETLVTGHGWPHTRTAVSVAWKPLPEMVSVAPPAREVAAGEKEVALSACPQWWQLWLAQRTPQLPATRLTVWLLRAAAPRHSRSWWCSPVRV